MISQVSKVLINTQAIFRHRLAEGASLLAVSQYIAAALNMVTSVLMARLLGPTDYGLAALAVAYPALLWSFVSVKSMSVITRYVAIFRARRDPEKLKGIIKLGYSLDFFVSLFALVLVAISSEWVSKNFYRQPQLAWLMVIYAGSFPLFSLIGTSWAILSSWERFRLLAIFEVLHAFFKLILSAGLIMVGLGMAGAVIGMGLAQAGAGLIMMAAATDLLIREDLRAWWKESLKSVVPLKRELMGFFGWNYLLVTLSGLVVQVPMMLLGRFRGPEEAGFYRIALSVGTVGSYLEASLGRVIYPTLSGRWSLESEEKLIRALKGWTLKIGLPISGILILTTIFFPWLLPLLYGHSYRAAVLGVQVIMLGVAISVAFFWLNSFYYASKRVHLWVVGYAIYAILVIGLGWFIVRPWGFMGLSGLMTAGKVLFTLSMFAVLFWVSRSAEPGGGSSLEKVGFIGGARYSQPLDATSEKKWRLLSELGEMFVIGFSRDARPRRFTQHARFYLLPKFPLPSLRYLAMLTAGPALALWMIFRHGVRIFIAQSPYEGFAAAMAKVLARLAGFKVVLIVESHGDFEGSLFLQRRVRCQSLYRWLMRRTARFALQHADLLRAISNSTRNQLETWSLGKPIVQFPTWTDIEVFLKAGESDEAREPVILYAGVLTPLKGVHHLLHAFAKVAQELPEARLEIIGRDENPEYAEELRQEVLRLGLKGRVSFVGEVSQAELADRMRRACVLVLPSLSEGLGRVVVEAMATGTPVIGSRVGGIPEMVQEGWTGFLVPPGDEETLAERLRWVLERPSEAEAMGRRAREFARAFFSPEAYLTGYRRLLEMAQEVLKSR
jgi:glycosyltransferase involved in cell wall biosynthesis/O-antigen/teichoic acid export membrane protein